MARHLYIAGVDRWPDLERNTLQIDQALTYQIDTCSFRVFCEQPAEGDEVIIEDDALGRLFAGIIVKVDLAETYPDKPERFNVWAVDCDDYTALLDRRLVVESYENMSASDIFLDIVAKYCPGFTVQGVQSGAPVIESTGAEFEYKRPSECFKWLCDYVGWHWQPDYYKDLQFFSAEALASPAPMVLEPGGKFRFGKHSIDTQGLRNRVYVRGGTMLSDPQVVEWKADGVARIWTLPWPPHEVGLQVGEVAKTVGVENLHEEKDFDYMMSFSEKYIRCSAQTATPVEGATMSLTARQDIDVITMAEDIQSQAAVAAVQGGDGVYEHVINDTSFITIEAAEAAGFANLREHANPRVKGSFETEVNGWQPGQLVTVNLSDRGVNGTFLVQRVSAAPTWASPSIWTYRVEYGGRLLGIADFLKALVSSEQKKQMVETAILHKFVYGTDEAIISDEIFATHREPPWEVEESLEIGIKPIEIPPVTGTFTRDSIAYKQSGEQVAANTPRYETGKFNQGIWLEEGTTNLIGTCDFEGGTVGWTLSAAAARSNADAYFGSYSLALTNPASPQQSTYEVIGINPSTTYTFSVYAKSSLSSIRINIVDRNGGTNLNMDAINMGIHSSENGNTWKRYTLTWTTASNADGVLIRVVCGESGNSGVAYLDGLQLEKKPYATSFAVGERKAEFLRVPTSSFNKGSWTVSLKYKTFQSVISTALWRVLWDCYIGSGNWYQIAFQADTGKLLLRVASDGNIVVLDGGIILSANKFYDITATGDGTNIKLYVDGQQVGETTAYIEPIGDLPDYMTVGTNVNSHHINGIVDDFRIDKTTRTGAEILSEYNKGQPLQVDKHTTCKLSFDNSIAFSGATVPNEEQFTTVGSLLSLVCLETWGNPQISTSEDGTDWTDWQGIQPDAGAIKVPYPGFVRLMADKNTKTYNWKIPLDETDTVCGFVLC